MNNFLANKNTKGEICSKRWGQKMKYKLGIILLFIFMLASSNVSYADTPKQKIICDATINRNHVVLSGQIQNATGPNQLLLLVSDYQGLIYLDQVASDSNGNFVFSFYLPENYKKTNYNFRIGTDADTNVYHGSFVYVYNKFLESNLTLSIKNYVPTLTGNVICEPGHSLEINIFDSSEQKIIANDVITEDSGLYNLSYTLPSLSQNKSYHVVLNAKDDNESLILIEFDIDTSILLVSLSGDITVSEHAEGQINVKSLDSNLINSGLWVGINRNITKKLPNIVANSTYSITAVCDKGELEFQADREGSKYEVYGTKGKEFYVLAKAENVSSLTNRIFTLSYDSEFIESIALMPMYVKNGLVSSALNTEILTSVPGQITFRVTNVDILSGNTWNGVLNVFKFKLKQNCLNGTAVWLK